MAEILYIRIGSVVNEPVHWLIWQSQNQEIIASGVLESAEQLSQLTEKSKSRQVKVLVSNADVALHQLNVPAKSQRAVKLAAPYMLEDDLAYEVDDCFFAYGKQPSNNEHNCFVAVVNHKTLKSWLQWLSDADITTKEIIPDAMLLPCEEGKLHALQIDDQILVKRSSWQAHSIDLLMWPVFQNALLAQVDNNDVANRLVEYTTLPNVNDGFEVEQSLAELPLAELVKQDNGKSLNLLQGQYQVIEKRSNTSKTWFFAAGLALTVLLMNVVGKATHLMQLNDNIAATEQNIIKQYKSTFPETKRVRINTIKSQLKRKVDQISSSGSSDGFLTMLQRLEPAFTTVSQLKPDSIKYDGKRQEIRMQATAKEYQDFELFKVALEQQGFKVNQGAQNSQGDSISGSFSLTNDAGGRK